VTLPIPGAAAPVPGDNPENKKEQPAPEPDMEVRCTNGSVIKLKVLEEQLTLKTPYGKLLIPLAKVNEVECATRIPEETSKRIAALVLELGSDQLKTRDDATAELAKLGVKAYPALLKAEKDKDAEVQKRARQLLEKVRKSTSEEALQVRDKDIVHTEDSKISGQLETLLLKCHTDQFGEVKLKLSDVRSLRNLAFERQEEDTSGNVLPDPGHLHMYQAQIGKVFKFRVNGAVPGVNQMSVWGTDVYTLDSNLATAAVHAGIVQPGKQGIVKVKIHPAQNAFQGSIRNGVATSAYGLYPGAYEILKK